MRDGSEILPSRSHQSQQQTELRKYSVFSFPNRGLPGTGTPKRSRKSFCLRASKARKHNPQGKQSYIGCECFHRVARGSRWVDRSGMADYFGVLSYGSNTRIRASSFRPIPLCAGSNTHLVGHSANNQPSGHRDFQSKSARFSKQRVTSPICYLKGPAKVLSLPDGVQPVPASGPSRLRATAPRTPTKRRTRCLPPL